jgi:hypothetical protein
VLVPPKAAGLHYRPTLSPCGLPNSPTTALWQPQPCLMIMAHQQLLLGCSLHSPNQVRRHYDSIVQRISICDTMSSGSRKGINQLVNIGVVQLRYFIQYRYPAVRTTALDLARRQYRHCLLVSSLSRSSCPILGFHHHRYSRQR